MKGLQRSLSRAPESSQKIVKKAINVNFSIDITGSTGVAVYGTQVVGDMAAGDIVLLGVTSDIGFDATGDTHIADEWEGDYSVGTTPTSDTTLSGTEVDIIPSTALIAGAADKIVPAARAVSSVATLVPLDNRDGSLEVNLNLVVDADEITNAEDATIVVSGKLELSYVVL